LKADLHNDVQKEHLLDIFNPKGDGWCGWRAAANFFEGNQDNFPVVKEKMLKAFHANKESYWSLLDFDKERDLERLITSGTNWVDGDGDAEYGDWFTTPECAQVVADAYGIPVVVFPCGDNEALTFLPLALPKNTSIKPPSPLLLQNVKNRHWISLKMKHTCKNWPVVVDCYRKHPKCSKSRLIEDSFAEKKVEKNNRIN
ncbi:uncharacterized protein EV154DRAFT_417229, partial [Mucor mucedo]|uniref:uncharacterized protein n=2 Tax=Mucor mucedo TaxID=29922 RepID=UPI00221F3984